MSDDRTVAPSRRRIQQARAAGQVAHSRELTAAAALGAIVLAWGACSGPLGLALAEHVKQATPGGPIAVPTAEEAGRFVAGMAWRVLLPLAAIAASGLASATLAQQAQTGFLFVPALALPSTRRLGTLGRGATDAEGSADKPTGWDRLAPVVGQTARMALVGLVLYLTLRSQWTSLLTALESPWPAWVPAAGSLLRSSLGHVALALLVSGMVDYLVQWHRWNQRLRATPQEQRQEQRAQEGDPALRSRRRNAARLMIGPPQGIGEVRPIGAGSSDSL